MSFLLEKERLAVLLAAVLALFESASYAQETGSTVAARQMVFGIEHVDADTGAMPGDKAIFSWLTNSTFATAIAGRVILLDSFVTRLEVQPGRTPFVISDIVNLRPEAILLGHGHGDHANNAAYIAAKTGATIYATEETCGTMQIDFERMLADPVIQQHPEARFPEDAAVICINVTSAGSRPGTEVLRIPALEPQACVTAFRHLHSVAVQPDESFPPTPVQIIVDPRDEALFPAGVPLLPRSDGAPLSGQMNINTTPGAAGGAESLFYSFLLRGGTNFSFVWHNTAGALKEGKGRDYDGEPADGQRIIDLLEALRPVDLQMGTASTGNFDNNGLRDLIMYQAALQPSIYIPNHITSGTRTREASSLSVYAGYLEQLDLMGQPRESRPQIRWLTDPVDYLKPISFDLDNPAWSNPQKADALDSYCMAGESRDVMEITIR